MNSEIDLRSAEDKTSPNSISTDSTTIGETLPSQASPVANSTPIRSTLLTGVRTHISVACDSPFLRRIPKSFAHIKGRPGVNRQPSVAYQSPNLLRRIPRTFSHIKGRTGIKMPPNVHPNARPTSSAHGTEASPQPPENAPFEHLFEAELVDVEVLGSAAETLGSAVEVLGTAMTLLGEASVSEGQRMPEPQSVPATEEMTDKRYEYPCSIS
ncbi:uncharacterized protein LOC111071761 [Drosophila obscura]|uniref:uncharacterized protein LOC111071761 n=1 Tax=Drosophila obscura TaxID=7282 RepID=UPI001BB1CA48|nr:uncharacterized protein LOC111071761 [Drosophila obscura]